MLLFTFLYAGLLIVLTATAFLRGAVGDAASLLFFAGAVTICALFALKSPRHGFVGATMLALLVVFTASARVFGLLEATIVNTRDLTHNVAALVLSLAYLMAAHGTWQRYRRKVALEELERDEKRGK